MNWKKFILFGLVCGLASLPCGNATAKTFISVGTNPVGMALYTMGASLADVMRESFPDIELTIEATNGGVHNLHLMAKGDVEMGFTAPKEAMDALNGEGRYKSRIPLRGLFSSAIAHQQSCALASSGIHEIAQVRDKRIGVGPPGALSRVDTENILSTYGISFKDFKAFSETLPEMSEKMKNGQLDAVMWNGVPPLAALMDLAKSRDIVWLKADPEKMKTLIEKCPWYFMTEMPAGTYTNQNENIPVLAQRYLVVALDSISEEAAYQITKAAVSNFKRLSTVYKGWSTCSVETVLQSMNIPLHPGAIRYYREINLPGLDDYIKAHPAK